MNKMGKMNKIKAIIFDLGNVVIDYDHMIATKKMSKIVGIPATALKDMLLERKNLNLFEKGNISEKEFWERIEKKLNMKIDGKLFDGFWSSMFSSNRPMEKLVRSLKKHHKLALLSNIGCSHKDYICKRFKIIKAFDVMIFSNEVGARKPEREIYELALRKLGTKPEETLYFDDRADFVAAARKLGINAFQFKSISQLKKILRKFNVIT